MLDFLLKRGEDLNEICGPGGTILHALIVLEHLTEDFDFTDAVKKSVMGNPTYLSNFAL